MRLLLAHIVYRVTWPLFRWACRVKAQHSMRDLTEAAARRSPLTIIRHE